MSRPTRTQQRFPFRAPVHVRRNNRKLPPITQSTRPLDEPITPQSTLSASSIGVRCETPEHNINDFWDNLHEHIANQTIKDINDHGKQNTTNKVVRIFVSSTFTDFFNEREVLIKKVTETIVTEVFEICLSFILK